MYMKLNVYCENGHEGMICEKKWYLSYVYVWYVLEGLNAYLEEVMSKWIMDLICDVLECVNCDKHGFDHA